VEGRDVGCLLGYLNDGLVVEEGNMLGLTVLRLLDDGIKLGLTGRIKLAGMKGIIVGLVERAIEGFAVGINVVVEVGTLDGTDEDTSGSCVVCKLGSVVPLKVEYTLEVGVMEVSEVGNVADTL